MPSQVRERDSHSGWILTGATGLVGRFVLRELLRKGHDVCVLIRRRGPVSAEKRMESIVRFWEEDLQTHLVRPLVLDANLLAPGLNVTNQQSDAIRGRFKNVLHCAASVRFDMDSAGQEPLATNIDGTRHLINFVSQLGCEHFHHVSTAYVCGETDGPVVEGLASMHAKFRNPYEYSKAAAEQLVRNASQFVTKTFYRPSIVIGRYRDGWANAFHTLYASVRFARELHASGLVEITHEIIREILDALGLKGNESKNVVPVDWVADAISTITDDPSMWGRFYHLTNPKPASVHDIANSIVESVNRNLENWRHIPTATSNEDSDQDAFSVHLEAYSEYFRNDPLFDQTNTSSISQLRQPPAMTSEVLTTAFNFAINSKFCDSTGFASDEPSPLMQVLCECMSTEQAALDSDCFLRGKEKLLALSISGIGGGTYYLPQLVPGLVQATIPAWALEDLLTGRLPVQTAVAERLFIAVDRDGADKAKLTSELLERILAKVSLHTTTPRFSDPVSKASICEASDV